MNIEVVLVIVERILLLACVTSAVLESITHEMPKEDRQSLKTALVMKTLQIISICSVRETLVGSYRASNVPFQYQRTLLRIISLLSRTASIASSVNKRTAFTNRVSFENMPLR